MYLAVAPGWTNARIAKTLMFLAMHGGEVVVDSTPSVQQSDNASIITTSNESHPLSATADLDKPLDSRIKDETIHGNQQPAREGIVHPKGPMDSPAKAGTCDSNHLLDSPTKEGRRGLLDSPKKDVPNTILSIQEYSKSQRTIVSPHPPLIPPTRSITIRPVRGHADVVTGKDWVLHCSPLNTPALNLYTRMGFKTEAYVVGFYDGYFDWRDGGMDEESISTRGRRNALYMRLRR
jgi:hypothetical protein